MKPQCTEEYWYGVTHTLEEVIELVKEQSEIYPAGLEFGNHLIKLLNEMWEEYK
jgi:hypothetical protein